MNISFNESATRQVTDISNHQSPRQQGDSHTYGVANKTQRNKRGLEITPPGQQQMG